MSGTTIDLRSTNTAVPNRPYINVQSDFGDLIQHNSTDYNVHEHNEQKQAGPGTKFWCSISQFNNDLYDDTDCTITDTNTIHSSNNDFIVQLHNRNIIVRHSKAVISTVCIAPSHTYTPLSNNIQSDTSAVRGIGINVLCVDINNTETELLYSTANKPALHNTSNLFQIQLANKNKHIPFHSDINDVDVNLCQYLQSQVLAVTAGLDFAVRIWNCETYECALTMSGHTRAITSLNPIDKGRHIVTTSLDGTVKLFDTAQHKAVATTTNQNDIELLCATMIPVLDNTVSNRTLIGAGSDGSFYVYSIQIDTNTITNTHKIIIFDSMNPITALHIYNTTTLLAGTENGHIVVCKLTDNMAQRLYTIQKNDAKITCFASESRTDTIQFYCGNSLGELDQYTIDSTGKYSITNTLIGADCEPIKHIKLSQHNTLYAASFNAIRKYELGT